MLAISYNTSYDKLIMTRPPSNLWTYTALSALAATIWFLWPQLAILTLTALMAYVFYPMFVKLKRKNSQGYAAAVTTLIASFLVVLIPLAIIVLAAISQLFVLADVLGKSGTWEQLPTYGQQALDTVNAMMKSITGTHQTIDTEGIFEFLRNTLPNVARTSVGALLGIVSTLPQLGIALLIYTFVFIELLVRGPALIRKLKQLSPYPAAATNHYFERIGLMANAMVKGQLMISMIISAISATLLVPLGYGQYFFILFIVFTILNFIPLGCGIVLIPLVLYSMLTGQFWMGVIVLVLYNLAGWLDPILRPKFIPKTIELSSGLTIVSTFCGIAYFGILGVIYGPIIMILLLTTFDLYAKYRGKKVTKTA